MIVRMSGSTIFVKARPSSGSCGLNLRLRTIADAL
jgi:hypothetical protein